MNEELQNKLIECIQKLGDIASEQLPDFAQQIIEYIIWSNTIWMWSSLVILCIVTFFFIYNMRVYFKDKNRSDSACGSFILAMIALVFICGFCISFTQIKKCEMFPKLVLIEYLRGD